MKKQHTEEMAGFQDYVSKIKALSQEKEAFTESMEEENEALRTTIAQLTAENEAFNQENAAIAELCLAQGVQDESGGIPEQPTQFLIQERKQLMDKMEEETREKAKLVKELEELKQGSSKKVLLDKEVTELYED